MKLSYMRRPAAAAGDPYFAADAFGADREAGHHRRLYLLFLFAGLQVPVLWLLSRGAF